ncbi:proline-rich transmembrane protein 1-like [Mya arenaria]|uniref:proline-rich transmembrane protein 1-like n=1 Tax=Mya arenaria TaxID=6604 RepID=UPI0022E64B87|nr:proline-rich transmembrane protein 1-like [Mya arenaria]
MSDHQKQDAANDQGAPPQYQPQGEPAGLYQGYGAQPANVVVTQPSPAKGIIVRSRPPDYLIPSILSCLCFWPTGVAAIFFSLQASKYVTAGNFIEAEQASRSAKIFMIVSFVVGGIGVGLVIIVKVATAAALSGSHH